MKHVQFISNGADMTSLLAGIKAALDGGCRWIQLRQKGATAEELEQTARQALPLCRARQATFVIDDNVDVALRVGADGVHLGKNDMPIADARKILGEHAIIGGTANTFSDVENIWRQGGNYIGCGPFRFTTTKTNLSPILGTAGYRDIVDRMRRQGISLPIVAIGGITADDIPAIMQTGVTGVALSGTVLRASQPAEEMKRIISIIKEWEN